LNCDKALFKLKWEANLNYKECIKFVSEWYFSFYQNTNDMMTFTRNQIHEYEQKATEKDLVWCK
jgi:CDP-glucose 4,6-dehydratase